MNDDDLMTIEDCAQSAKCTWRTARKRLDAAGLRPAKSTKKSALYDRIPALRATLYAEKADLEMLDKQIHFFGKVVMPGLYASDSPLMQYFTGLLRERGVSKAEALQSAGGAIMMTMEALSHIMPGEILAEPPDWLKLADEISNETGLNGLPLLEEYAKRYWPDPPE